MMTRYVVRAFSAAVVLVLILVLPGLADPVIEVGDHAIERDQPNQEVLIYVTGGDPVAGVTFSIRTGDALTPTPCSAPQITALDILGSSTTPTIFFGNNNGQFDPDGDPDPFPRYESRITTTAGGTVDADGLLAMLTLDATGVFGGTWALLACDPAGVESEFAGSGGGTTIHNGTVWIDGFPSIPEPSTLVLLLIGLCSIWWRWRAANRN